MLVVNPETDGFSVLGWIHPDYEAAARDCGHVSPGVVIDLAQIAQFSGSEVLLVTSSTLVELSATSAPARDGTTLSVGRPKPVRSPDWEALQTPGSAFASTAAFGPEDEDGMFSFAFTGTVSVY